MHGKVLRRRLKPLTSKDEQDAQFSTQSVALGSFESRDAIVLHDANYGGAVKQSIMSADLAIRTEISRVNDATSLNCRVRYLFTPVKRLGRTPTVMDYRASLQPTLSVGELLEGVLLIHAAQFPTFQALIEANNGSIPATSPKAAPS